MKKFTSILLITLAVVSFLVTPTMAKSMQLTTDAIRHEPIIISRGVFRQCQACGNGPLELVDTSSETERFAYDSKCAHYPHGYDYYYSTDTNYYYKCSNCGHSKLDNAKSYRMECHGTY